ncbi:hypothetical protein EVJ58_g4371 [Rhodofomes roseus]|uniref:Wax synthase domain-containing protein n=1 Tax=Rhodofomes roseus TaxID=34475 RepID=A0A4Y9YGJ6_9APHY|nr:hypothetical protein EVJ58_g4371 [Rhodofomes roseus]
MIQAFSIFLLNWLTNPVHEFRHERDYVAPEELPFLRRMWWTLCVINSPRGVGWSYEVANTPPRPSQPRWSFVREKLSSAFRWFLFLDLAQSYQRSNLLFSRGNMVLLSQGHSLPTASILARLCSLVGMIAMQYSLLAAIFVAFGFSLPRDWPDIYGRWSDTYTVRRFWGRTYHQMLRRLTAGIGKAFCCALGLRPGTWASSYTQLYAGFAISGLIHCGGDLMVDPSLFGASFPFYILQAVAITFEDAIIGIVRRSGVKVPRLLAHLIGYTWAISWLCICAPWSVNWSLKSGIVFTDRIPLSLIDRVIPGLGKVVARCVYVFTTSLDAKA